MPFNIQNSRPFVEFPFGINVQKRLIEDFQAIEKFGRNDSVGTSFETIWSGGGIYVYPTTATTAVATSSDTGSDNGGTVKVFGLNQDYDLANEVITIGGSASTTTFIRVFRALMVTPTTGTANVGTITITVDSKSVALIDPEYGQTLMCVYTIPRNKTGYLVNINASASKSQETEFLLTVRSNTTGTAFNTKAYITTTGNYVNRKYDIPDVIIEKSDIELRAKSSATESVSGGFELFIEDDH